MVKKKYLITFYKLVPAPKCGEPTTSILSAGFISSGIVISDAGIFSVYRNKRNNFIET